MIIHFHQASFTLIEGYILNYILSIELFTITYKVIFSLQNIMISLALFLPISWKFYLCLFQFSLQDSSKCQGRYLALFSKFWRIYEIAIRIMVQVNVRQFNDSFYQVNSSKLLMFLSFNSTFERKDFKENVIKR